MISEIAQSSMQNMTVTLSKEDKERLEDIKAKATANISSYLAQIEILKAEVNSKIAQEIAKVEIAETLQTKSSEK